MNKLEGILRRVSVNGRTECAAVGFRRAALATVLGIAVFFSGCASTIPKKAVTAEDVEARKKAVELFIEGKTAEAKGNRDAAVALYFEALQYNPRSDDIALALAKACAMNGKMKSSLHFSRMAADINPLNVEAWRILQYLYQQESDIEKAAESLEIYIKLKQDTEIGDFIRLAQYYGALGKKDKMRALLLSRIKRPDASNVEVGSVAEFFADNEMYEEAVSLYTRLIERDPADVDSWVKFGFLYSEIGQDSKAVDTLNQGLEKNPDNQSLIITIGNICMRQNNWDCAIAHFEKARASGINAPKILMTLSALYFNAHRFSEGEALRDSVIAMGEDGAPFYFSLGKSMNYLERYQDAADYYLKGFGKPIDKLSEEEKLIAYVGYIKSLIRLGKKDEAIRVIQEDASKNIKDSENVKDIEGIVYMELKRYDDAIAIYKWLADADPDNPRYVISLSQAYYDAEKYVEAERALLDAMKKDPDNTRFLMQLGIVYDASKEFDKAEDVLLRVIKKEPDNSHALNNLAYMYIENGRSLSKAIEMVKRALTLDPNNGAYLDTLGWGYFRKGNFSEAKTHIERALNLSERQDKGVIYDHYGDILLRMGSKKEAGDAYKHAIEYGEDKEKIQKKIDSLE